MAVRIIRVCDGCGQEDEEKEIAIREDGKTECLIEYLCRECLLKYAEEVRKQYFSKGPSDRFPVF